MDDKLREIKKKHAKPLGEGHTLNDAEVDYLIEQAEKLKEVEEMYQRSGPIHEETVIALGAILGNLIRPREKAGAFDKPTPQNVDIEDKRGEDDDGWQAAIYPVYSNETGNHTDTEQWVRIHAYLKE